MEELFAFQDSWESSRSDWVSNDGRFLLRSFVVWVVYKGRMYRRPAKGEGIQRGIGVELPLLIKYFLKKIYT